METPFTNIRSINIAFDVDEINEALLDIINKYEELKIFVAALKPSWEGSSSGLHILTLNLISKYLNEEVGLTTKLNYQENFITLTLPTLTNGTIIINELIQLYPLIHKTLQLERFVLSIADVHNRKIELWTGCRTLTMFIE